MKSHADLKKILSREEINKEVQKANWLFTKIVGMVLRPGGLVDFTLRAKELALNFAKLLNELESVKNATAHADTVVEVRIDFIPPRLSFRIHYRILDT